MGYLRFDSPDELELLKRIWALDGIFTNFLLAQQKLVTKPRQGAKVTKRYDRAQTPFTRAFSHPEVTDLARDLMNEAFCEIHMAALHDEIQSLLVQLEQYSLTKGLAPIRRGNRPFNRPHYPEELGEAMNQAPRRICHKAIDPVSRGHTRNSNLRA